MLDRLFKKFLAYSLPYSFDDFTQQFASDPNKKNLSIYQYIGKISEQYCYGLHHDCEKAEAKANKLAKTAYVVSKSMLINHVGKPNQNQNQNQNQQHEMLLLL